MTPEEKQQWDKSGLKEACQRAIKIGRTHQKIDIHLFLEMLLEIDRLESLVKEQEADGKQPVGWISCGLRHGHDRIVDIVFEDAESAKSFIDRIEPVTGPIIAADRMRSACVER